ncbi:hypothetical protein BBBOND_0306170 [Babesia bigemina]|uniref:Uncharacterized protein n=1 Tax=Babesia bigemina TaxID=5866 RepID=A0A061D849_BABBI|nr:hypothetical protein BBBOND_0306170 [Babesia bigemina]CDR96713.1 hypothetical protein BBBOND_0306170 [Babesia bigemina]|eukprot:XP_012768899.1 hypothetical protein BBBOND_0306170 [Babesia bigemina]
MAVGRFVEADRSSVALAEVEGTGGGAGRWGAGGGLYGTVKRVPGVSTDVEELKSVIAVPGVVNNVRVEDAMIPFVCKPSICDVQCKGKEKTCECECCQRKCRNQEAQVCKLPDPSTALQSQSDSQALSSGHPTDENDADGSDTEDSSGHPPPYPAIAAVVVAIIVAIILLDLCIFRFPVGRNIRDFLVRKIPFCIAFYS